MKIFLAIIDGKDEEIVAFATEAGAWAWVAERLLGHDTRADILIRDGQMTAALKVLADESIYVRVRELEVWP